MTQTSFYVSHAGQTYGPWTVAEITGRIAQMELIATDFVFDDDKGDWVPILEYPAIVAALRSTKPSAPPPKAVTTTTAQGATELPQPVIHEIKAQEIKASPSVVEGPKDNEWDASSEQAEWFVQKDTHRYGPFTYLGLIKALQEKSVFDFDLIWRQGMDKWVRVAEHEMFTADAIRGLVLEKANESSRFFLKRQHPRFPFQGEVIIHDNKSVWLGQAHEGSMGGTGLTINNSMLIPGQVLFLHFTAFDGIPAFNALCEIVSKKFVPNIRDARAGVPYGVKFVKIDRDIQEALKDYGASRKAA